MSTRAIAPVVGVSHVAVASDLNAGVKDLTPDPTVNRDRRDPRARADHLTVDRLHRNPPKSR